MNERQLADRIGNVDERLVSEARKAPHRRSGGGVWRIAAAAAAIALAMGLGGYFIARDPGLSAKAVDLMEGYTTDVNSEAGDLDEESSVAIAEFGLELLRRCGGDGNGLVSPVSVASALGMTALGARGDTLNEMSATLGMEPQSLARFLLAYRESTEGEELSYANSIWIRDDEDLVVEPDFLQSNADYYSAGAYRAPFDDTTVRDINAWTREHTGGMIDKVLNEIPESAVMYLINALSFDAEWSHPYEDHQVRDDTFTAQDGTEREVEMMYDSMERYFSDGTAQGILKRYDGGFAFAAILPGEGVTVDGYLASLTGHTLLTGASWEEGVTGIPKFTQEYGYELSGDLADMGMPEAFDPGRADLTRIGRGRDGSNLYISRVIHRTFIEVGERGTRAGAVTAVETNGGGAPLDPSEPREVILNRPFIYMIVDENTMTPIFIGVIRTLGE